MKQPFVLVLLMLLSACSVNEKVAMQEVFSAYSIATNNRNGVKAVACLSQSTLAHYDKIADDAKYAKKSELLSRDLLVIINVFQARSISSNEELAAYNGRTLFIKLVDNGAVKLGDPTISWDEISVSNDGQSGYMTGIRFFSKEDGKWYIDFSDVLAKKRKPNTLTAEELDRRVQKNKSAFPPNASLDRIWDAPFERP